MTQDQLPLYQVLGGEVPLKKLVHDFYQVMDTAPEARGIRLQHAEDLQEAEQKLFMFLSGWTGGPQLYTEKFGHPRLRARHLPFKIGLSERDQWLFCMWKALERSQIPEEAQQVLKSALSRLADHMRNQPE